MYITTPSPSSELLFFSLQHPRTVISTFNRLPDPLLSAPLIPSSFSKPTSHAAHVQLPLVSTYDCGSDITYPFACEETQSVTMLQCGRTSGIFSEAVDSFLIDPAPCVFRRTTLNCIHVIHTISLCAKANQAQCHLLYKLTSSENELCRMCGSSVDEFGNIRLIGAPRSIVEIPSYPVDAREVMRARILQNTGLGQTLEDFLMVEPDWSGDIDTSPRSSTTDGYAFGSEAQPGTIAADDLLVADPTDLDAWELDIQPGADISTPCGVLIAERGQLGDTHPSPRVNTTAVDAPGSEAQSGTISANDGLVAEEFTASDPCVPGSNIQPAPQTPANRWKRPLGLQIDLGPSKRLCQRQNSPIQPMRGLGWRSRQYRQPRQPRPSLESVETINLISSDEEDDEEEEEEEVDE